MSTQIDDGGAILAANDSDVTERATDHYSYLWTRDGAFVANALDLAWLSGNDSAVLRVLQRIAHPGGYFLQKYNPDGTVASGWHASWDMHGKQQLVPIQEDETALVLWALWQHYERYRDIDFAHRLYASLIVHVRRFYGLVSAMPQPGCRCRAGTCGKIAAAFTRLPARPSSAGLGLPLISPGSLLRTIKRSNTKRPPTKIVDAMRKHLYSHELARFLRRCTAETTRPCVTDPIRSMHRCLEYFISAALAR